MFVFSLCLDLIFNFKQVPFEILKSGLSNDMYHISKFSFSLCIFGLKIP